MDSNALILQAGGSDTQDGTLVRGGVGLTMAQLMNAGGKVVTRVLNAGYTGPYNPKNHIQDFFSEGEERGRALDELYKADRDDLSKRYKQLLKHCRALLKYALPECTVTTQLITFKILVAVITRYPGIRCLFHHPKCSKKASPLPASHFENLWNRPHQQCGKEWNFYRDFAVYCLTDGGPLTKLVESELPSKFGQLKLLERDWTKDPIESLLSFCSADSTLNHEKLCAIRYLAGILELPKIWRLKTEESIDVGKRLFDFLSHLCETIFQLIRDTAPSGSDDSEESEDDSSPRWTSARSAVDILAFATFGGFLQLHGLDEKLPPCPSQFASIVTLLIRPQMKRSFPKASGRALQVKEILDWQQDTRTNSLQVPPDAQNTRAASRPGKVSSKSPLAPERVGLNDNRDIIIAVMGPTGAGRSTLINKILGPGRQQTMVGSSLDSVTREVQAFECFNSEGRRIILVDSPGFNDTNVSDLDVLQSIADWLKQSYEEGKLLSGLLFLHRISDNRMAGPPLRVLDIFKGICGKDAFQNVLLVTTMWDEVPLGVGEKRESGLLQNDRRWKPMVAGGARTARFMNTAESAWAIISQFKPESRRPVLLQRELVDHQKPLAETAAGRPIFRSLEESIATQRERLQTLRKRLPRARRADPDLLAQIAQGQEVLDLTSKMISRYAYPQPVHRSYAVPTGNMMPEPQERSTTPRTEIATISVQDSDTITIASSQENDCAAPPSSRADNLAFDRINRRALRGSITALNVIHQLIGSSPIPGLQSVVATILKIAEFMEKIDCADNSLVSLYQNACSMMSGIIEIAHGSGVSGLIEAVVDSFIVELTQIKLIVGHLLERGSPHKIDLSNQDRMAVDECNRRLLSAYRRVILPADVIPHSKVRMEDRLDSAVTMLRNQFLPNL